MTYRAAIAGLCTSVAMATTANAQDIDLTMSHYLPPVLGLHVDFLEPFARELEEKSGGKIAVDIQSAGSSLGVKTLNPPNTRLSLLHSFLRSSH